MDRHALATCATTVLRIGQAESPGLLSLLCLSRQMRPTLHASIATKYVQSIAISFPLFKRIRG